MFTGLIQEQGVFRLLSSGATGQAEVQCKQLARMLSAGDSVAVNGVCLTVARTDAGSFVADVSSATLQRTTLGRLRAGTRVNLEPALAVGDRLGGHLVQGHVDGAGIVRENSEREEYSRLVVEYPRELARYIALKGSIAVDGVSLTVAGLDGLLMEIAVIPTTWRETNIATLRAGSEVNLEVDVIARYLERLQQQSGAEESNLSAGQLRDWGY